MKQLFARSLCVLFLLVAFRFTGSAQDAPTLSYPLSYQLLTDTVVTLIVDPVIGATSYEIELADNMAFAPLFGSYSSANGQADTNALVWGQTYYWRARSFIGATPSAYSEIDSFHVFRPSVLGSIELWLNSDEGITTAPASDSITQWNDLSGNDNHALQGDLSLSPVIKNSGYALPSAVSFDGSGDYLDLISAYNGTDFSAFIVFEPSRLISPDVDADRMTLIGTADGALPFSYLSLGKVTTGFTGEMFGIFYATPFAYYGNDYALGLAPYIFYAGIDLNSNPSVKINGKEQGNILSSGTFDVNASKTLTEIQRIGGDQIDAIRRLDGGMSQVILFNQKLSDEEETMVTNYISNYYVPPTYLGKDTIIANGFCPITLFANNADATYLWSDNSTADSLLVTQSGDYALSSTNILGITTFDTVKVVYPGNFSLFGTSTIICLGDTLTVDLGLDTAGYDFLWSDSSTDSILKVAAPGKYWVTVTDTTGCFLTSDTLTLVVDSFPVQVSLGPDGELCEGAAFGLVQGAELAVSYLWSTGETGIQGTVTLPGEYSVIVTDSNGCIAKDTIQFAISGQAPSVAFDVTLPCVNGDAQFSDASTTTDGSNIVSWDWDFGNGQTSEAEDTVNAYSASGKYEVTLEVMTDSGCVNTLKDSVQIFNLPIAGFFTTEVLVCSGEATNFTDNSFPTSAGDGTITGWSWDFGEEGEEDTSSVQNPDYEFATAGNKNVELTISDEHGCRDTLVKTVSVKSTPVASFTISNQCLGEETAFDNTSGGTIIEQFWNFGDAATSSTISPTHVYGDTGSYTVSLAIEDINGCVDTVVSEAIIYNNPVADFSTAAFCVPASYQFNDNSTIAGGETITQWSWDLVEHNNASQTQNPLFAFAATDTGDYALSLRVTSAFGCADSITKTVTTYFTPTSAFNISPVLGIVPLEVEFTNVSIASDTNSWSFGDGGESTEVSPMHQYADTGSFVIELIVTTTNGCADTSSGLVKVVAPILDIGVTAVYYEFVPGTDFLSLSADVTNFSTAPISSFNIIGEPSNSTPAMESWSGTLSVGGTVNFQFTQFFRANDGQLPDVVCARTITPNGFIDVLLENDELCVAVEEFLVTALFPNPAAGEVTIEYVLPEEDLVEIKLFDMAGEMIGQLFLGDGEKGFNRQVFDISSVSNGTYFIEVSFGGSSIKKKIVKK